MTYPERPVCQNERRIQDRFLRWHVKGEWFMPTEELCRISRAVMV